jgi:glutamyl-tRNA synthetase
VSESEIRVRFAPSPTGSLHIGGARTAYFNWLFARQHQGKFILRIDDTDVARSTVESAAQIIDGMQWLGLDHDEGPDVGGAYGPYRQSERYELYRKQLQMLQVTDKVYPCFCSQAQLAEDRQLAQSAGVAPRYTGRCRNLSRAEIDDKLASGLHPVYRLRVVGEVDTVVVQDEIHGEVAFSGTEVDDFIIWKADDHPTYHFASCVDDMEMKITHIIRAEEHLSNTPRHVMLFRAMGYEPPRFAHVPMILSPDRAKLSKRHGATSVQEFRDDGFLPEALLNGILLLGFSPGNDQEVVTRDEAIKLFDLMRVSHHSAMYDLKKMEWLNTHYIKSLPVNDLFDRLWGRLVESVGLAGTMDREQVAWVTDLLRANRERSRNLNELADTLWIYFQPIKEYDLTGVKKHFHEAAASRLLEAASALALVEPFIAPQIEAVYRALMVKMNIKGGDLIHPTRLAISGKTVGPSLFELMQLVGRAECMLRMQNAARWIANQDSTKS